MAHTVPTLLYKPQLTNVPVDLIILELLYMSSAYL